MPVTFSPLKGSKWLHVVVLQWTIGSTVIIYLPAICHSPSSPRAALDKQPSDFTERVDGASVGHVCILSWTPPGLTLRWTNWFRSFWLCKQSGLNQRRRWRKQPRGIYEKGRKIRWLHAWLGLACAGYIRHQVDLVASTCSSNVWRHRSRGNRLLERGTRSSGPRLRLHRRYLIIFCNFVPKKKKKAA